MELGRTVQTQESACFRGKSLLKDNFINFLYTLSWNYYGSRGKPEQILQSTQMKAVDAQELARATMKKKYKKCKL